MTKRKAGARKRLPSDAVLMQEYLQPGVNFTILGEKYGWHPSVISVRVKRASDKAGFEWPLKSLGKTPKRLDTVDARLASSTLRDVTLRYRITLLTISKQLPMNESVVRGIANGHRARIDRKTQAKILEFASALDAGEIVLPQERVLVTGADRCPRNHPYTGKRDSRGYRLCVVCRADKARRRAAVEEQQRRSAA